MGILDRFQVKAGGWRATGELPWELDLDRPAVAGVALRDPATLLWKLGPSDDPAAAAGGRHCFFARGAEAEVAQQRVVRWRIFWQDPTGRFAAFTGPCLFRGAVLPLHGGLREPALEALLGPPVWRQEEGGAMRWFYGHHAAEWELLFNSEHGLQQLTLSALPLYAVGGGNTPPSHPAT